MVFFFAQIGVVYHVLRVIDKGRWIMLNKSLGLALASNEC